MTRRDASEDARPPVPEPPESRADDLRGQSGSAEAGARNGQPRATADAGEDDDEYEPL